MCHYSTLCNTCVNLFITTVKQALHVMSNWQLWTNTSQQMFKVFAFGFDICIKTISPLINGLINDALFDAVNSCVWLSSGNLAKCLCMMRPTDLEMPVSLTIWWIVLCVWCILLTKHQIIDCINVLSSTWSLNTTLAAEFCTHCNFLTLMDLWIRELA